MRIIYALFAFTVLAMLSACEPEADLYRTFYVEKGEHYSLPRLSETLQSNRLIFYAKFDKSCQYTFENSGFQDSKNKLLGFADCNNMHHQNSARFAWQWFNNQMEIYAYCYVNGQRVEKYLGVVALEEENRYELELTRDAYLFRLNNNEAISIPRTSQCQTGLYYMLWPYFGGTLAAPHNMQLFIKIVQ